MPKATYIKELTSIKELNTPVINSLSTVIDSWQNMNFDNVISAKFLTNPSWKNFSLKPSLDTFGTFLNAAFTSYWSTPVVQMMLDKDRRDEFFAREDTWEMLLSKGKTLSKFLEKNQNLLTDIITSGITDNDSKNERAKIVREDLIPLVKNISNANLDHSNRKELSGLIASIMQGQNELEDAKLKAKEMIKKADAMPDDKPESKKKLKESAVKKLKEKQNAINNKLLENIAKISNNSAIREFILSGDNTTHISKIMQLVPIPEKTKENFGISKDAIKDLQPVIKSVLDTTFSEIPGKDIRTNIASLGKNILLKDGTDPKVIGTFEERLDKSVKILQKWHQDNKNEGLLDLFKDNGIRSNISDTENLKKSIANRYKKLEVEGVDAVEIFLQDMNKAIDNKLNKALESYNSQLKSERILTLGKALTKNYLAESDLIKGKGPEGQSNINAISEFSGPLISRILKSQESLVVDPNKIGDPGNVVNYILKTLTADNKNIDNIFDIATSPLIQKIPKKEKISLEDVKDLLGKVETITKTQAYKDNIAEKVGAAQVVGNFVANVVLPHIPFQAKKYEDYYSTEKRLDESIKILTKWAKDNQGKNFSNMEEVFQDNSFQFSIKNPVEFREEILKRYKEQEKSRIDIADAFLQDINYAINDKSSWKGNPLEDYRKEKKIFAEGPIKDARLKLLKPFQEILGSSLRNPESIKFANKIITKENPRDKIRNVGHLLTQLKGTNKEPLVTNLTTDLAFMEYAKDLTTDGLKDKMDKGLYDFLDLGSNKTLATHIKSGDKIMRKYNKLVIAGYDVYKGASDTVDGIKKMGGNVKRLFSGKKKEKAQDAAPPVTEEESLVQDRIKSRKELEDLGVNRAETKSSIPKEPEDAKVNTKVEKKERRTWVSRITEIFLGKDKDNAR